MSNIIIIHGSFGNPKENWFPYMKKELELKGHRVFIPKFPTPKQSLTSWMKIFEKYQKYLNENTIIIGHSLGPSFLLSVLEKSNIKIKAAYFVSGFIGDLGNNEFDKINKTFTTKKFNWSLIKNNCKYFCVINSNDDPYVPLKKGKELSKKINAEFIILKNAGHINTSSNYKTFPFLLNKVLKKIEHDS
ncbi:MAG: alpha/beta hydrolase [Candidatus Woesearchaeota archaeon]|jgi:hypothetical protein